MNKGICLRVASDANLAHPPSSSANPLSSVRAGNITEADHKSKLTHSIAEIGIDLTWEGRSRLYSLFCEHHNAFVLVDGEMDIVTMEIHTGEAQTKRHPV